MPVQPYLRESDSTSSPTQSFKTCAYSLAGLGQAEQGLSEY